MTYKAWLLHMINVRSDADIAVAKALRYMLQVTKAKILTSSTVSYFQNDTFSEFFSTVYDSFFLKR